MQFVFALLYVVHVVAHLSKFHRTQLTNRPTAVADVAT